jgi:hypothetical protein
MKSMIALAGFFLLMSCNNSESNKTVNAASGGGSEISVTLTGGDNAGIYHVISNETTCSEGLTGENSFGNQYSEEGKPDNDLSSLQLIIDDKEAAKKGTDKFSISVGFGKLTGGKTYSISTRDNNSGFPKKGSGKATFTESNGNKTVVVEGKTEDGVGISATITCNKIMTANGIQ